MSGESAAERWSPAQRVESVLISILSLLDDAEVSSPANVDAAVMYRTDLDRFRSIVKGHVDATKAHRPADFEMPTTAHEASSREIVEKEDEDFWAESGDDSDPFGGSDSDSDMDMDHFTGSDDDDEDDDNDPQDNTS
jgi:ubiquitin-conjugating enzyme E2 R